MEITNNLADSNYLVQFKDVLISCHVICTIQLCNLTLTQAYCIDIYTHSHCCNNWWLCVSLKSLCVAAILLLDVTRHKVSNQSARVRVRVSALNRTTDPTFLCKTRKFCHKKFCTEAGSCRPFNNFFNAIISTSQVGYFLRKRAFEITKIINMLSITYTVFQRSGVPCVHIAIFGFRSSHIYVQY